MKENCILAVDFVNEIQTSDDDTDDDEEEESCEKENSERSNSLCVLCCDKERKVLFLPCKHCKVCRGCFGRMNEQSQKSGDKSLCPICRAIINDSLLIYM